MSKGFDLSRVIANYQNRTQGKFDVVATLHDSAPITANLHKVLITLSSPSNDRAKNYQAIANLFKNEAAAVVGSFRVVPSSREHVLVGFITKNVETREVTTASLDKFKVMAGNLLMDTEDSSLWELKIVEGNKYLSRKTEETLSDLVQFASIKHHNHLANVGKIQHLVMASVQEGEYAVFASHNTNEVHAGYVISSEGDKLEILCSHDDTVEEISSEQLIESTFITKKFDEIAMPENSQGNKEAMKEYYKKLYSYSPEYYEKMAAIIDGNAAI